MLWLCFTNVDIAYLCHPGHCSGGQSFQLSCTISVNHDDGPKFVHVFSTPHVEHHLPNILLKLGKFSFITYKGNLYGIHMVTPKTEVIGSKQIFGSWYVASRAVKENKNPIPSASFAQAGSSTQKVENFNPSLSAKRWPGAVLDLILFLFFSFLGRKCSH
jgi:hypothetical protein